MSQTPLRVFPTPEKMGEHIATRLLGEIEAARESGMRFLLGCPTGRTPRPVYAAMAKRLASAPQDLSQLVLVMMDEYLVSAGKGFAYAPWSKEWSCHHFARVEIFDRFNAGLNAEQQLRKDSIWFPDPRKPENYDDRIVEAGGIDFFVLASGASDGHVAFNPPGSPRESRTRVIELSEETRRDNLKTFPSFGTLNAVPTHGISVGIDTIVSAKECAMLVTGTGKRLTLERMTKADHYDPQWPATVIHECAAREILADSDAASALDGL
jgi:glucosamine-6-phosphate deaminase